MTTDFESLAKRIETSDALDEAAVEQVSEALSGHLPDKDQVRAITAEQLASSDHVIHLIDDTVPGWAIHITGTAVEPDGHWHCTLRRSDSRDSDEFIGHGTGKVLSHALTAGLLRTVAYMIGHHQIA